MTFHTVTSASGVTASNTNIRFRPGTRHSNRIVGFTYIGIALVLFDYIWEPALSKFSMEGLRPWEDSLLYTDIQQRHSRLYFFKILGCPVLI